MIQHSIWELESFYAPKDVIITGSGLSGLWSAYYLKLFRPSLKILIVEKGIIPSGASTRNAGFACFGSVTELIEDAKTMGRQKMLELVAMRYEGLRRIKKILPAKKIALEKYGGFEIINSEQYQNSQQLKDDISWLNCRLEKVVGHKNIFRLSDKKIKKFGFRHTAHLIENKLEGQLHSGKMMQFLVQKLQASGVMIMTGTELKAFNNTGDQVRLYTDPESSLITKQLLICTNAFASELLPGTGIIPARGQVLVTSPIKGLPFRGTFHYDSGYYYFRNLGNKILLGGARNKAFAEEQTLEAATSDIIQLELERFLREVIIPEKDFTIENRWSGIMGMGASKFPTIKKIGKGCFSALGMGGMGVALAPVVGEQTARLMLDKN